MASATILLSLFTLTAAFPWEGRWHKLHKRFLDEHHRGLVAETNNCKQLTTAAIAWIRYSFLTQNSFDVDINLKMAKEFGKMIFGFDIFRDEAAVEEFMCSITNARTVEDLKAILDSQNDFNFRAFKFTYDNNAISLSLARIPESVKRKVDVLKSVGLLSLDPEGIRYMIELATEHGLGPIKYDGYLSEPVRGNLEQKCQKLQDLFWNTVSSAETSISCTISSWTGIDLHEKHQVNTLLCDIVKAAEVDIQSVYKVLEENGIVDNFYQKLYPEIVDFVRSLKRNLELMIPALEESISEVDPLDIERVYSQERLTTKILLLNFLLQLEQSGLLDLK